MTNVHSAACTSGAAYFSVDLCETFGVLGVTVELPNHGTGEAVVGAVERKGGTCELQRWKAFLGALKRCSYGRRHDDRQVTEGHNARVTECAEVDGKLYMQVGMRIR